MTRTGQASGPSPAHGPDPDGAVTTTQPSLCVMGHETNEIPALKVQKCPDS
jgi:hypothetical protein